MEYVQKRLDMLKDRLTNPGMLEIVNELEYHLMMEEMERNGDLVRVDKETTVEPDKYEVYFGKRVEDYFATFYPDPCYSNEDGGGELHTDNFVIVSRDYYNEISNNNKHE